MHRLKHIAQSFTAVRTCKEWHPCAETQTVESYKEAESMAIKYVQHESFSTELQCLDRREPLSRNTPLRKLDPFIGVDGLLIVGDPLNQGNIQNSENSPIIITNRNHMAEKLLRRL
jgi:hypothetical protein